jgi:hypothetical protein
MESAEFSTDTFTPDRLIAGDMQLVPRTITVLSGQSLLRGTLLGKTSVSATVGAAVADAGNTGNGTVGTVTAGAEAKNGNYRLVCVEPGTNAGVFAVFNPNGIEIGRATVGVAFTGGINFTIADGSADFISGDAFTVAVSAAVYKYLKSAAAATDGSEVPDLILADDCDASAADATGVAYATGIFDDGAVIYGTGHTADSVREGLRKLGIHLIPTAGA